MTLLLRRSISGAMVVAKKDMRLYYVKGPVIIFGLLFPLFLFLSFSIGRELSGASFAAPMLVMALFFTSSAVGPIIAPWETRMRTLEKLLTTPISIASIVLGGILAGFIFGVLVSSTTFGLAVLLTGIAVGDPMVLAALIVLGAVCFSSMGILISFPATDNPSNVMMLANLVKLPLVFVSGVFVPLTSMSGLGGKLALLSPLTYFADGVRGALGEAAANAGAVNLGALGAYAGAFALLAVVLHARSMPKRF